MLSTSTSEYNYLMMSILKYIIYYYGINIVILQVISNENTFELPLLFEFHSPYG